MPIDPKETKSTPAPEVKPAEAKAEPKAEAKPLEITIEHKPAKQELKIKSLADVKEIDGVVCQFRAAVPKGKKGCEWDKKPGTEDDFIGDDEYNVLPGSNYLYTKIRFADWGKKMKDAWLVKTEKEMALFVVHPDKHRPITD
jgi:hypothetical protein